MHAIFMPLTLLNSPFFSRSIQTNESWYYSVPHLQVFGCVVDCITQFKYHSLACEWMGMLKIGIKATS
jgi:hypothetical protein